jgi:hypothetical protein
MQDQSGEEKSCEVGRGDRATGGAFQAVRGAFEPLCWCRRAQRLLPTLSRCALRTYQRSRRL